ncbi:helix-turn-helix domain-containing protein [Bhargavaea beijingensis]|uniref:helix-turn-helix domain-containing protein n=1 Tax=Bhargavaea beijingensis TaxID=426756 RepID=UPI0022256FD9|nr:helix-turn-helix domain-containing protein [Bhargavaea beijingensis]MCW1929503.1 helix-turn-helix domain-containing protein [Bhargavaea beijingensis]
MEKVKRLITLEEASAESGKSISTLRRWVREKKIVAVKKGRSYFVAAEDLEEAMNGSDPVNDALLARLRELNVKSADGLTLGDHFDFNTLGETFKKGIKGIRYDKEPLRVMVVTTLGEDDHIYNDHYDFGKDFLIYSGEGQKGDQTMTGGNLILRRCQIERVPVSVVSKLERNSYRYLGEFNVVDHRRVWGNPDDGGVRKVYEFMMMPAIDGEEGIITEAGPDLNPSGGGEVALSDSDLLGEINELDNLLGSYSGESTTESTQKRYKRSRSLVKKLKELYDYKCQLCHEGDCMPEIIMKNGKKMVEVHHIQGFHEVLNRKFEGQESGDFVVDNSSNLIVCCLYHHGLLEYSSDEYRFSEDKQAFVSKDGKKELKIQVIKHEIRSELKKK